MSNSQIPEVSVADVPADAVLLDVREDGEWQAGHAPGAIHVPMTALGERLDEIPQASPLYVICRSGARSARVTAYLNASGWNAVNVASGLLGWQRAARPLIGEGDRPATVM